MNASTARAAEHGQHHSTEARDQLDQSSMVQEQHDEGRRSGRCTVRASAPAPVVRREVARRRRRPGTPAGVGRGRPWHDPRAGPRRGERPIMHDGSAPGRTTTAPAVPTMMSVMDDAQQRSSSIPGRRRRRCSHPPADVIEPARTWRASWWFGPQPYGAGVQLRYAYRLDPTPGQCQALARAFGCARGGVQRRPRGRGSLTRVTRRCPGR